MAVPTPISGLPSATPASGDLAVIVHSGVTSKTTLGDILDLVNVPVTSVAGRTGAVVLVSTDITDSTSVGRAVLTALDAASARTAIGAGVGDALTSGTLGQFAATTSAQLAGVLTDETGSGGGFVRATSPTISAPILTGSVVFQGATSNVQVQDTGGSQGQCVTIYADSSGQPFNPRVRLSAVGGTTAGLQLSSVGLITWSDNANGLTVVDTALRRNSAGVVEINNGTAGTLCDLTLRNLTASVQVIAPSGSAAAPGVAIGASATGLYRVGSGASADIAFSVAATQIGSIGSGGLSVVTYTVATLPSASANAGRLAQVTDSNTTTNGSTVAGGGANRVPVYSNGTNWIVK